MGMVTSLNGCFTTMMALQQFVYHCLTSAPVRFDILESVSLQIEWSFGWAFLALVVATLLKLFDVFCHLIVKTPSARWNKPPDELVGTTQIEAWMALATDGVQSKAR